MNISFSGDTRDLFKFDLVRHLMKSFPDLGSFTFIPMLTDRDVPTTKKKSRKTDLTKAIKSGEGGFPEQGPDGAPGDTAGDRR